MTVGLLTTYRAALPVWIQGLDGNATEAKSIPQLIQAYMDQLREGENPPYIVVDNALYSEEVLVTYKGQGVGPERGFRFLKDLLFFADSLFLKSPQGIIALITVMGLALLGYALAEHQLRQRLQETGETILHQVGKRIRCPTLRRIFQRLAGIDVLVIHGLQSVERRVLNLSERHQHILRLLGSHVQKCYFAPG